MLDSTIELQSALSREQSRRFYERQMQIRACARYTHSPFNAAAVKSRVLGELGRMLGADRCFLLELRDGNPLPIELEYRKTDAAFSFLGTTPPWDRCPFLRKAACNEFAFSNDILAEAPVQADPELHDFFVQANIRSGIACPVLHQNELISVLAVQCQESREWLPDELSLVMLAADQITIASTILARQKAEEDEKQAALALKASEERLQRVLKGSNDAFWDWNLLTNETYWSERFYDILNLPKERQPSAEWGWQLIHPDDRTMVEQAVNACLSKNTARYNTALRMRHGSGEYRWLHARAEATWDDKGCPIRLSGSYTDITDRVVAEQTLKESEERFRTMAEASTVMIVISDTHGRVTYLNRTCLRFFGYSFEELAAKNWVEFIHPDDRDDHLARFTAGMASSRNFNVEFRMRRADGEYRWIYADIAPMQTSTGEITGYIGTNIDITERKQAESALRENEMRFRRVVDSNIIGFAFWDKTSRQITDANDALLNMLGYNRDDLQAGRLNWQALTPPEYAYLDQQAFKQMNQSPTGKCDPYEKQYIAKDGHRVDILLATAYYENSTDSGVAYILDITERKKAERALAESEKRFRAMADQAPFMLAVSEKEGKLSYFNKPWFEFTGRSHPETLAFGWLNDIHPQDRDIAIATYQEALDEHKEFDIEYRLRRRDGVYRWVFSQVSPRFTEDGSFFGYIGSIIDIHERKLAQTALENSLRREQLMRRVVEIVNQSPLLAEVLTEAAKTLGEFFQVDRAYILRYEQANNRLNIKLFGEYCSPTIPVPRFRLSDDLPPVLVKLLNEALPIPQAMSPWRCNTPDEYGWRLQELIQTLSYLSIEEQHNYEQLLRQVLIDKYRTHACLRMGIYYRSNPCGIIILQQCQPRNWTDEEVSLVQDIATQIGVAINQSELYQQEQQARQELESHARKLEISNRDLEQFATIASHDLQEPLRKVYIFSQMIAQHAPSELQDYTTRMQSAVGRMQDLINDLLMLSRVNRKGRPFCSTDLNQALHNTLTDLEVRIQESQARIIAEPLATIKADPQQMEQLFLNLLSNSLKYSHSDSTPEIRIFGKLVQQDNPPQVFYQIDFSDNGIGFRNDQAERIFEPFERLHGRSQHYPGTGMGLTICRKIVERHHGTITARSDEGQGATFTILLPMGTSIPSTEAEPQQPPPA